MSKSEAEPVQLARKVKNMIAQIGLIVNKNMIPIKVPFEGENGKPKPQVQKAPRTSKFLIPGHPPAILASYARKTSRLSRPTVPTYPDLPQVSRLSPGSHLHSF